LFNGSADYLKEVGLMGDPEKVEPELISAHASVREMYERVHESGMTNVVDRWFAQQPKCPFCSGGVSCQLCSNGPCRITDKKPNGVCGITADGAAMRYMLFRNVLGMATYTYHAVEAVKTLLKTAELKTPFALQDLPKLNELADFLGLEKGGDTARARELGEYFLADIYRPLGEPSAMVKRFAPAGRLKVWEDLGLIPYGASSETIYATSSILTNVDGDYVSLAKKAMRLGISCTYSSLVPLEMSQDILFGTPRPHATEVDMGIIDPAYVNLVVNGHEPFVGAALIAYASRPEIQEKARVAGARGLRVIGSIETGQELHARFPLSDVFRGVTGNFLNQEFVLATGAVDLFAMDMNCSQPELMQYGEKFGVTMIAVSPLVNMPDLELHLDYRPEEVEDQAARLVDMAVESYRRRRDRATHVPAQTMNAVVGFSADALLKKLGGSLDPLLDTIREGSIRGLVALVSCASMKNRGQDVTTLAVTRELIARDVLIIAGGCGNGALQVGGLARMEAAEMAGPGLRKVCKQLGVPPVLSFGTCTDVGRMALLVGALADALGVDVPALPAAVTAPEWHEQKATIDAVFAVAFGLYTHVSPIPPVTGGEKLVRLLTEEVEGLTGGKMAVGDDPAEAVQGIVEHIERKRKALGI
jgi:carbon-monoxide dehydrogenase catalytic subunit